MNEETQETICAALALAMGYYVIEECGWNRWQVAHNSGVFPFATRERCEEFVLKTAPGYLTDWKATGALIEWAVSTNLSVRVYPFRGAFLGEVDPIDSSTYYEAADCKTAQEALVRAIYAAIKARAESERK